MVDVIAGGVDATGRIAVRVLHLATGADEDELIDRRLAERHAPVEQPEVVGQLRIAGRDVTVAELPHRIAAKMR